MTVARSDGPNGAAASRAELFRAVNDRIRELSSSSDDVSGFHCECGRPGCNEVVEFPNAIYDALRSLPGWRLTAAGHEVPSLARRC